MNLWHDVSLGENAPDEFNCIIEIPRGSLNKYEVDKETGLIALDRVSHTGQTFPFDYGFVPRTYWEDNDPLDVIVLTTQPLHPGILARVRAVGYMKMIDGGDVDDKIIAVPVDDPRWKEVQDIGDIAEQQKSIIKHFYETYKQLQNKEVTVSGFGSAGDARGALEKGAQMYKEKFGK